MIQKAADDESSLRNNAVFAAAKWAYGARNFRNGGAMWLQSGAESGDGLAGWQNFI